MNKRIKNYLEGDLFREEFSHTLLHNQNVFEQFKKIRQRVNDPSAMQPTTQEQPVHQNNNLFHPTSTFTNGGGDEDFYKYEMEQLVKGV